MSDELPPALERELLDDFHSEADELLVQMHAQLAALGQPPEAGPGESLGALYRAMHSMKGISGIVGLRVVEELAHAAEDVLRRATRDAATLPPAAPELLDRTLQRIGRILAAHRTGQELPPAADLQEALCAFGQDDDAAPGQVASQARQRPRLHGICVTPSGRGDRKEKTGARRAVRPTCVSPHQRNRTSPRRKVRHSPFGPLASAPHMIGKAAVIGGEGLDEGQRIAN